MSGSGAITRLVALGAQDVHITGSPQLSFFNSTHKRHTNFSIFQEQQTIHGNPKAGITSTIDLRRSGDMLNYCFLTVEENGTSKLIDDWSSVIDEVELYIGDQLIDRQSSEFTEEMKMKEEWKPAQKRKQCSSTKFKKWNHPMTLFKTCFLTTP